MNIRTRLVIVLGMSLALTVPALAQGEAEPKQPETPAAGEPQAPASAFDEMWLVIRSAFYDPKFHGVDWDTVHAELAPKYEAAKTPLERSTIINEALERLHSSHTHHYIQDQREYYELLDVFFPDGVPPRKLSKIKPGVVEYVGIGMATRIIDGHFFAYDVYDEAQPTTQASKPATS